jgi:hypothetical protein
LICCSDANCNTPEAAAEKAKSESAFPPAKSRWDFSCLWS